MLFEGQYLVWLPGGGEQAGRCRATFQRARSVWVASAACPRSGPPASAASAVAAASSSASPPCSRGSSSAAAAGGWAGLVGIGTRATFCHYDAVGSRALPPKNGAGLQRCLALSHLPACHLFGCAPTAESASTSQTSWRAQGRGTKEMPGPVSSTAVPACHLFGCAPSPGGRAHRKRAGVPTRA